MAQRIYYEQHKLFAQGIRKILLLVVTSLQGSKTLLTMAAWKLCEVLDSPKQELYTEQKFQLTSTDTLKGLCEGQRLMDKHRSVATENSYFVVQTNPCSDI